MAYGGVFVTAVSAAELAERDAIAAAHAHILSDVERRVHVHASIHATNATVLIGPAECGLVVTLSEDGISGQDLFLDAVSGLALARALDEALAVCAACGKPGVVDVDVDRCVVVGDWLHADCHAAVCDSPQHETAVS